MHCFNANRGTSANVDADVMGCQSACYEWADSYDSKVGEFMIDVPIRH
jgi:hypothetical protein